jgi:hypothetical protein
MVNTELKDQIIEFISLNYGFSHWEKKFYDLNNVPDSFFGAFVIKYQYDLPSYSNKFFFKANIYKIFKSILSDRRKMSSIIKVLSIKYASRNTKFTYKWNSHMSMWFIYVNHLDLFIDDDFNKFAYAFKPTYKIEYKISLLTDIEEYDTHTQADTNVSTTFRHIPIPTKKKSTKEEVEKVVSRIKEILSV